MKSPLFEIKQVVIRGNLYLAEENIRTEADINMGINIFKINLAAVADKLKMMPMIKDARVTRVLPSTVLINVTERRPLGLLPVGNSFVEVDEEGICLQKAGSGVPGIPIITGIKVDAPGLGERVKAEHLEDALMMTSGLPDEVINKLSEVHVDQNGQIKAYTLDRIQCRLGEAVDIREKGVVLARILQEMQKQGAKVKYIDLTSVGKPVVKY
ncbi:FtsQ-type POTRA domain-containing protein [Pelotomaculum isophthalicicum JI]|uniref:FtsQ-type POTRA domain-containing protein n=1 Tax=Pelotomaculum isophthalicicum JI TaxID=947010 RepID=A0A9X4JU53_9FIRM|nr:FtsQ-type POTRA domain-containing protein [Pelotomaculum isophthalicicum]MDF9409924.1 FtsQ-type POTRA domain-containing protein [Pelotomaculum isophthalicicum JI]